MHPDFFSGWGLELNIKDFCKASTVRGILGAYETALQVTATESEMAEAIAKIVKETAGDPLKFNLSPVQPKVLLNVEPINLATAWDKFQSLNYLPIRIEVDVDQRIARAANNNAVHHILDILRSQTIGANSAFFHLRPRAVSIDWQWPIRVGFLSDPDSINLSSDYQQIAMGSDTVRNLTRGIDTKVNTGTVDLLLVSHDLESVFENIENTPYPIHANVVGIMGGTGGLSWTEIEAKKQRICELTGAQGVLIQEQAELKSWLHDFVVRLSHAEPIDTAISGFQAKMDGQKLWATNPLLDESSIVKFTSKMVNRAVRLYKPDTKIVIEQQTADRLGLPDRMVRLGDAVDRLQNNIYNIGFLHESDGATVSSDVNTAIQKAIETADIRRTVTSATLSGIDEPPPQPSRYLQAGVYAVIDDCQRVRMKTTFAAGWENIAEIEIGPKKEGSITAPEEFPAKKLPPTEDGAHLLTVVFMEPNCMDQPILKTILLPPSEGSLPCRFSFTPKQDAEFVEARVTVLYENRVMQSATLRGPATRFTKEELQNLKDQQDAGTGSADESTDQDNIGIHFVISGAVKQAIERLSERPRFDAAIVLNDTGGVAGGTLIRGNKADFLRFGDSAVKDMGTEIERKLDLRWHDADYRGLYADGTTTLLRELAVTGRQLYDAVVEAFKLNLADARKIQVVVAKQGSRIPLEYVYDYPAPRLDAKICPHAEEALATGECSPECTTLKENPARCVCPLGFWCMNRVLEWHAFDEKLVKDNEGADFKLEIDERRDQQPIELLGSPVLGYSNKVTEVEDKAAGFTLAAFKHKYPSAKTVQSWVEWKSEVQRLDPSILILLTHTGSGTANEPLLEIGPPIKVNNLYDWRLPTVNFTRAHIFGPNRKVPPIVFLLGCKTDDVSTPLRSVVATFQARGAAIVVSTSSDMYGPLAGRIADLLLEWLSRLTDTTTQTFGDIMLQVRRQALKEGIPMVLCIHAYGDSDWKLAKKSP